MKKYKITQEELTKGLITDARLLLDDIENILEKMTNEISIFKKTN